MRYCQLQMNMLCTSLRCVAHSLSKSSENKKIEFFRKKWIRRGGRGVEMDLFFFKWTEFGKMVVVWKNCYFFRPLLSNFNFVKNFFFFCCIWKAHDPYKINNFWFPKEKFLIGWSIETLLSTARWKMLFKINVFMVLLKKNRIKFS